MKIAVVDDVKGMRQLYERICKKDNYDLAWITPNANNALEKLEGSNLIDVMIIDYRMPEMNGLELIKKIKSNLPEIKIIMISADDLVKSKAMSIGVFDFLEKPFSLTDIRTALERCVCDNTNT